MQRWIALALALAFVLTACGGERAEPTPAEPPSSAAMIDPRPRFDGLDGFWSLEEASTILERTERLEVRADTSALGPAEQAVLERLVAVGEVMQRLYEDSRHPQARAAQAHLETVEVTDDEQPRLEALRSLYRLFQGPVALRGGEHVPFVPVTPYEPGRNVYPTGVSADTLEAWATRNPDAGIRDVRTVVRPRTLESLTLDRGRRNDHPVLDVLHPTLRETLSGGPSAGAFYTVPYALAYAGELLQAYGLLREAAALARPADPDLADYLAQRARDLLTNDYEAGDAAWVSGRFERLNAQIGAYETYDDHLLGRKAFFGLSILVRAPEASAELERGVAHLADLEAALPGGPYQRVRGEIPIGIYDVVADFGQARGGNTASILPNEPHVARKYGRTILIRRNVLMSPTIMAAARRRFRAAVADAHADDLAETGAFDRTVWHEVGHYLGPKRTTDGRDVSDALGSAHNLVEELKADLVSLWLVPRLVSSGTLTPERARAAYAAGVLRTLVTSPPPRTSPYATMQLMQQQFLLAEGALTFAEGRLSIDYERLPVAVERMLMEVLGLQRSGDRAAVQAFVERWARWDEAVQGVLGPALDAVAPRYWLPVYPALGEP